VRNRVLAPPLHIAARVISQIFRAAGAIVKVHASQDLFARELAAYRALAGSSHVPAVLRVATRTLVLEDLGDTIATVSPIDVAALLGRVHAAARPIGAPSLAAMRGAPPPAWIVDRAGYAEAIELACRLYGNAHVPIALGDLKRDHVRVRANGELALIDFETFAPGVLGEVDVLALANFTPHPDWCELLAAYHRGRGRVLGDRELALARACLGLVVRATRAELV
jgi:aminoglycoside phosphotransferase (APT) family kinase protein